jgi:hypothetical protein
MQTWAWIVIAVVAALVVVGVAWAALRTRQTKQLREQFGSEYDRVAADAPTRREAESELQERRRRREQFDIRPLAPERRDELRDKWIVIQAEFVDAPGRSLAQADSLIQTVMRERGYPVEDFDTRSADLSVDHPDVVENYRAGHGIVVASERGRAGTDELRRAFQHYRALFEELLDAREPARDTR